MPFVLHGASGLSDGELTAAVAAGVAKVNVNAELRRVYFTALHAALGAGGDDIPGLQERVVAAMAAWPPEVASWGHQPVTNAL